MVRIKLLLLIKYYKLLYIPIGNYVRLCPDKEPKQIRNVGKTINQFGKTG